MEGGEEGGEEGVEGGEGEVVGVNKKKRGGWRLVGVGFSKGQRVRGFGVLEFLDIGVSGVT